MPSARAFVFFGLLPIAAGAVLRHRITPILSTRTSHLLLREASDASAKRGEANVTVEYQKSAYEWYMIDIQLGTPRKLVLGGVPVRGGFRLGYQPTPY